MVPMSVNSDEEAAMAIPGVTSNQALNQKLSPSSEGASSVSLPRDYPRLPLCYRDTKFN